MAVAKGNREELISPSLLANLDPTKKVSDRYKLGMSEWTDSSDSEKENAADFQPPKKRLKKAVTKGKRRFREVVSPEELERISKGFVPKNTEKNTLSTFKQWITSRNERCAENNIDILSMPLKQECTELCRALCLFVVEARKGNGEPYPAKTLYHLLAGLLRFARTEQPAFPNFLDPKDVRFKKLQGTMDTQFRKLCQATSVAPTTLFGSLQSCTINLQLFNQPSIQNFQGMTVSVSADDTFVDSILANNADL